MDTVVHAQAAVALAPQQLTEPVTDHSGVLDAVQFQDLTEKIRQHENETGRSIHVVFVPDFAGLAPEDWAEESANLSGVEETTVMAVATDAREFNISAGLNWSEEELDAMYDAALPYLGDSDWNGAAHAVVDASAGPGEASLGVLDSLAAWLDEAAENVDANVEDAEPEAETEPTLSIASTEADVPVGDHLGLLTDEQIADLTVMIESFKQDSGASLFVMYLPSMGEREPREWAAELFEAHGADSGAMLLFSLEEEYLNVLHRGWTGSREDAFNPAGEELGEGNFFDGASAFVDIAIAEFPAVSAPSITRSPGVSSTPSDTSPLQTALEGFLVLLVIGGGYYLYRKSKSGKNPAPAASQFAAPVPLPAPPAPLPLEQQPTQVLEQLAQEELVSTDESIRRGREELDLAIAELGTDRTRSFTRALNHSATTLQQAFALQQLLYDAVPETAEERRSILLEIIRTCSQADDALDEKAGSFAEMRNLMADADLKVTELTQRTVDLRTRLPRAERQLATLRSRYSPDVLESIDANDELASAALDEAEKYLATAQDLCGKPVGQQTGLVDAIRLCEQACERADHLLSSIARAEGRILTAQADLDDLTTELTDEITEAGDFKRRCLDDGMPANWTRLDDVVARAITAVQDSKELALTDPVKVYDTLSELLSELDGELDGLQTSSHNHAQTSHARQLQVLGHRLQTAVTSIQVAEDLIASRGRTVGAQARTDLVEAKRLVAEAEQLQNRDLRAAISSAERAVDIAGKAALLAQENVDEHLPKKAEPGVLGSVASLVINELLNDNRSSGFDRTGGVTPQSSGGAHGFTSTGGQQSDGDLGTKVAKTVAKGFRNSQERRRRAREEGKQQAREKLDEVRRNRGSSFAANSRDDDRSSSSSSSYEEERPATPPKPSQPRSSSSSSSPRRSTPPSDNTRRGSRGGSF